MSAASTADASLPATPVGSDPSREPFETAVARNLLQVRVSQATLTVPLILVSLVAIDYALQGRADDDRMRLWAIVLSTTTVIRGSFYFLLKKRIPTSTLQQIDRYDRYGFVTSILNGLAMGSSFWLVAAHGDMTVKLVITLVNCFFAIATIVSASRLFWNFVIVTLSQMGQGVLFWFGIGWAGAPQFEVAIPFLAVTFLMLSFAKSNSRQFQQALAIRTENLRLLEQLENEKKIVERALEEARKASESKSRFLAAASHDLRQPLHALTMFLGTLTFHVTTDDAKRLLGRIKDTTDVLRDQFDSLLDLSKFDAGAVRPDVSSLDLAALAKKLIEEMRPDAQAKGLMIFAEVDPAGARTDPLLIERVLRNLLANAVKYTASGTVTVRTRRYGAEILVEVIDTGPGIAPEQQGRIFEEYVQLENPARQRQQGVGLGLAIVKRIDALLQLRLSLQSSVGVGTTFSFCLPASDDAFAEGTAPNAMKATDYRTDAVIWVLDDDVAILEGFKEQLSAWGARVETFSDPGALLAALRAGSTLPRWIFTDDMLGAALSGLETAQMLSREFGFGRVCLVTGNTEPGRLAQLRGSGFPVIIKPARPEDLAAILSAGA